MIDDEEVAELLRTHLQRRDDTQPHGDVVGSALKVGDERLRRKRQHVLLAIASVAVLIVVVAPRTLSDPRQQSDATVDRITERAPSQSPTVKAMDPHTATFEWAENLPRGDGPSTPYLTGTKLHTADGQVLQLDAADAEILGAGPEGIVLLVESLSGGANRYQLVSTSGDVRDLGDTQIRNAQEALVSPAGDLFTDGSRVIDLATGVSIAEIPGDASVLIHWVKAGIVYGSDVGIYRLWDPDSGASTDLGEHPGRFTRGSEAFIRRDGGCSVASLVSAEGVRDVGRVCDGRILTASSDGQSLITDALQVVGVGGGIASLSGAPPDGQAFQARFSWTSNVEFLTAFSAGDYVGIPDVDQGLATRSLILRCNLDRLECERATDVVEIPKGQGAIGLP